MTDSNFQAFMDDFVVWHFNRAIDVLREHAKPNHQAELTAFAFSVLTDSLRIVRHEIDLADAPLREEIERIKRLSDDPATAGEAERREAELLQSLIDAKRNAQGIEYPKGGRAG